MKRPLRIAALVAVLVVPGATTVQAQTVILVRHAEKADQSSDPGLSQAGEARVLALAAALSDADLAHVFVTPARRTRETAALSAQAHALTPDIIPFDGGTEAHIARVAERVRALPPDAVVLVVGHSNTVPLIAAALGETGPSEMRDCEYDRLTVLALRSGDDTPAIISRYGAPSDC